MEKETRLKYDKDEECLGTVKKNERRDCGSLLCKIRTEKVITSAKRLTWLFVTFRRGPSKVCDSKRRNGVGVDGSMGLGDHAWT